MGSYARHLTDCTLALSAKATSLKFVEDHVQNARGRVLVIETSSVPKLERTRKFYAKRGYSACGQVPDFYADGEDKVIFAKRLGR